MNGRISHPTWINWCDGIKTNLSRPSFSKAWREIKDNSKDSFTELIRLEKSDFTQDPRSWLAWRQRLKGWLML
jgi:hypothetical protein